MKTATFDTVHSSIPRVEGRQKVSGRAEYIHNLRIPGMLYGKIFRSTVAHGRIRSIDVSAAAAFDGVHRVITGNDIRKIIPDPYYGPVFHDQPILAIDKVRFVGEPVAVVLATDPHVAEEAARLVVVDYEELPAVFNEVEATTSPVIVHDVLKPAGTFPDFKDLEGRRDTNIHFHFKLRRGDVDAAFAAADHVFEHTFNTRQIVHAPLEPMVSLAEPTGSSITIHTASQMPFTAQKEVARLLGWPENRVRVRTAFLGGGFGQKGYIRLEAIVTALALLVRLPVKISLTVDEQFYTITKHANTLRLKSGVTRDGRITSRRCDVWWNGGAYADIGPRLTQKSGFTAAGPYDIENVHIDSYAVYTNLPPASGLRGFGIPTLVWAYESHTDLIARELKIDPLEFRRKNLLRNGRPQATGTVMKNAETDAVLERLAKRMDWEKPFDRGEGKIRRGRGIGIGFKASIAGTTSIATVNLSADGSCKVQSGSVDMGQGSATSMAQIAAQTLNIPVESVKVGHVDTDTTPYDMGTVGSRSLFHMGEAVRLAAEDARNKLHALASELGLPAGSNIPIAELFQKKYGMQVGNIIGFGSFNPKSEAPDHSTGLSADITPFWMIGGTGAEVEVDTETGHVRILRLVNVADAGKAINPKIVESQLSGAAIMQLGCTMFEKIEFDAGQVTNASLADYKIPGIRDLPDRMENEIIEAYQDAGPYGAKGAGETGTFAVSPAITNAIQDAVGIRLTELPATPESLYRALARAKNDRLAEGK
jgi:CO/xanthine dehydrogenase Mo-binding subunit